MKEKRPAAGLLNSGPPRRNKLPNLGHFKYQTGSLQPKEMQDAPEMESHPDLDSAVSVQQVDFDNSENDELQEQAAS